MTDEQWADLEPLAEVLADAKRRYEALCLDGGMEAIRAEIEYNAAYSALKAAREAAGF